MKINTILLLTISLSNKYTAFATTQVDNANESKITINKPNVILIYGDDMGKGMISAYGQKLIETPNIDKLVTNGVQFNQAYGAHYSAPARAGLLTGYCDVHEGHWKLEKGGPFIVDDTTKIAPIEKQLNSRDVRLAQDDEYIAEVFRKAGYYTGQIGKLEYGFLSSRQQVKSHGWDYFYGFLDHQRCHGFFPPFLFENDDIVMIDGNTRTNCADAGYEYDNEENYKERLDMRGKVKYSQDLFNDKIKEFLNKHKDEPFFLYHPTQLPHGAVCVSYIHEKVKYLPNLTPVEKEYATMVLLLDEAVGMILDEVERLGIADNTMIIFSVDNGHEIYYESDHRTTSVVDLKTNKKIDDYHTKYNSEIVGDIFNGNMGMSGKKKSNLEGGVRVPLTYYFPNKFKARECNEIVANYDMIATMADMLNVDINKNKDAKSYYPLLIDPSAKQDKNHYVYVDSHRGPAIIVNDGWKLRYSQAISNYELFYLPNDYEEINDLSKKYPEKVQKLRKILLDKVTYTTCWGQYENVKSTLK